MAEAKYFNENENSSQRRGDQYRNRYGLYRRQDQDQNQIDGADAEEHEIFQNVSCNLSLLQIPQQECPKSTLAEIAKAFGYPSPIYQNTSGVETWKRGRRVPQSLVSSSASRTATSTSEENSNNHNNFEGTTMNHCFNRLGHHHGHPYHFVCKLGEFESIGSGSSVMEASNFAACEMMIFLLGSTAFLINFKAFQQEERVKLRYVKEIGFRHLDQRNKSQSQSRSIPSSTSSASVPILSPVPMPTPAVSTPLTTEPTTKTEAIVKQNKSSQIQIQDQKNKHKNNNNTLQVGQVIAGKYELLERIEEGNFGIVYRATDLHIGDSVAIKFESNTAKKPLLKKELKIMKKLGKPNSPVPQILHSLVYSGYLLQVMPFIGSPGSSLQMIFDRCGPLSSSTVMFLARQMVACLSYVHGQGFIHRDIKPANFLVDSNNKVWIIDFGLSESTASESGDSEAEKAKADIFQGQNVKKIANPKPRPKPKPKKPTPTGTPRFCSHRAQLGQPQTCQDDLKSLGYVLVYLQRGTLPWIGITDHLTMSECKRTISIVGDKSLTEGCVNVKAFISFFKLVMRWIPNAPFDYTELGKVFSSPDPEPKPEPHHRHRFEWEM